MKKWLLVLLVLTLTGCNGAMAADDVSPIQADDPIEYLDNTPVLHLTSFDETKTEGNDLVRLDLSHTNEGYIGVHYLGTNIKPKTQITLPDGTVYTYNLSGAIDYFNLPEPSGEYTVSIYENTTGTKYSKLYRTTFNVEEVNDHIAFLYNNQFIDFNENTLAIAKSSEVVAKATSELDKIQLIFNYVVSHLDYDHELAKTVTYGYIPNLDEVLNSGTGICFDYAALMACMLRTQNIATKMEFGYVNEVYHAWISVYTEETGWINNFIHFENDTWQMMDPTFVSQNPNSSKVKEFTTDTSNYQIKYIY